MPRRYSEKERKLFKFFKLEHLMAVASVPVMHTYRAAMEQAFLDEMTGPEVESIRRCMQAFNRGHPYRNTDEWENLIEFTDDSILVLAKG